MNEDIWDKVGVASVVDKMKEGKLKWFGYVKRRCRYASKKMLEVGYSGVEKRQR